MKDTARWEKIKQGIWDVEIGLDSAMCDDGEEDEETKEVVEGLLKDATRLRKHLLRAFEEKT